MFYPRAHTHSLCSSGRLAPRHAARLRRPAAACAAPGALSITRLMRLLTKKIIYLGPECVIGNLRQRQNPLRAAVRGNGLRDGPCVAREPTN